MVCFGVGKNFGKIVGVVYGMGVVVGGKGKFVGFVVDFGCFEFFFGFVDGCNFWLGVDNIWNDIIVYVFGLIGEYFGDCDIFVFGFVC